MSLNREIKQERSNGMKRVWDVAIVGQSYRIVKKEMQMRFNSGSMIHFVHKGNPRPHCRTPNRLHQCDHDFLKSETYLSPLNCSGNCKLWKTGTQRGNCQHKTKSEEERGLGCSKNKPTDGVRECRRRVRSQKRQPGVF